MSLGLGAIADDYTGASDLANTLARQGLRAVQTIGVPSESLVLPDVDAVVVALKTRSIAAADAVGASLEALAWLRERGAGHILFKVCSTFDSTDEGNIGPVTEALAEALSAGLVLVTPAFPETRRTVYQGNLFVGSVPLHESPLKDHPLNPMTDSNLVRVLQRQSRGKVGLIPLAVVDAGAAAIRDAMTRLAGEGFTAAVIDAVSDHHLPPIGEAAAASPLSTGASGLGLGLARALRKSDVEKPGVDRSGAGPAQSWPPVGGGAAILAGSCSAATLGQIAAVEGSLPVLRLGATELLTPGTAQAALAWTTDRLASGPVLIASSATPAEVQALQREHGRNDLGHRIEQLLADIAEGLVERGVRRLIVAGGETSGAVVDRLQVEAFQIGEEIAPGVPVLRRLGRGPSMLMALKSGNFGGPDFFARALGKMA